MPSSHFPLKPQIAEEVNTRGSELFFFLFMFHVFKNKEENTSWDKTRLTSRKALWKASDTYRSVRPSAMIPETQNNKMEKIKTMFLDNSSKELLHGPRSSRRHVCTTTRISSTNCNPLLNSHALSAEQGCASMMGLNRVHH